MPRMTVAFNILAILAAFGGLCILAALSLVIVIIREIAKLLGLLRDTQAEVRTTVKTIMPHVKFERDQDQSKVEINDEWSEKNELRD